MTEADRQFDPCEPPVEAGVGFAVRNPLTPRHAFGWGGIISVWAVLGALLLLWIAGGIALGAAGIRPPSPMLAVVLGAAVVAVLLIIWRLPISNSRIQHKDDIPVRPTPDRRIWCICPPRWVGQVLRHGPIEDVAFEPEVFAAPFVVRPKRPALLAWFAISAAVFGALALAIRATPTVSVPPTNILIFSAALAMGWIILVAARPTSIRIVPGRIDVLRGWFYSADRPVIQTFDLRRTRVVVDMRSGILFMLGPAKDLQADAMVAFGSTRMKARITHAILRAAVSTAEPPPLPDAQPAG